MRIDKTLTAIALLLVAAPAAARDRAIEISRCPAPIGSMAVADGDTQGWTRYGLGSPRQLIGALIEGSGCFTVHDPTSAGPADFVLIAVAGDRAEIDQGMNIARAAITETALRTGVLSRAPVVGGALGMFRGLGGQRRTIMAGLRVMNPANGLTLATGTGESSRSTISWGQQAAGEGRLGTYTDSRDGRLLSSAFAAAFNEIVAQAGALPVPPARVETAAASLDPVPSEGSEQAGASEGSPVQPPSVEPADQSVPASDAATGPLPADPAN